MIYNITLVTLRAFHARRKENMEGKKNQRGEAKAKPKGAAVPDEKRVLRQLDVCILCGASVPEGIMVCPCCEHELEYGYEYEELR